jgi:AGZA family xanthine/uracil permease-like MFS transporter
VSLHVDATQAKIALGYAFMALVCVAFAAMRLPEREVDPSDPADVEEAAERLAARAPAPATEPTAPAPVPA